MDTWNSGKQSGLSVLQCKFIFNSKLAIELDTQSNFMQHPEQMNSS